MKKLLILIFSLTLLLPFTVNAEEGDGYDWEIDSVEEGSNSASATVTIGSVAVPVYNVDMVWENPSFDWTYNEETKKFGWTPTPYCSSHTIESEEQLQDMLSSGVELYTDNSCSTEASSYDETVTYYEKFEREYYYFGIEDTSENGEIVPSIKWTPSEEYNYVEGKFSYSYEKPVCKVIEEEDLGLSSDKYELVTVYSDASCSTVVDTENVEFEPNTYYALYSEREFKELTSEEIPEVARDSYIGTPFYEINQAEKQWAYGLILELENKETPTTTPTAGDTLGTIKVTIRARETE